MASGEDQTKNRSIVIVDMPIEFINREVLKKHFEKFGTVERVACSVSKKYAVLHFSTPEEARNAELNGIYIKEGTPPLKIFNRGTSIRNVSQIALAPPQQQPTRLVTRRKIVRTFENVPASTSRAQSTATTATSRDEGDSPALAAPQQDNESSEEPIASTSKFQQAPLRSSIRISRPSPFLKRKASFGDKSGKGPTGPVRNPFALPPRSLLSLDRRRKTTENPNSSSRPAESGGSFSSSAAAGGKNEQIFITVQGASSSIPASAGSTADSAEIQLSDEDNDQPEEDTATTREQTKQQVKPGEAGTASTGIVKMPFVDVDETTEDATFNEGAGNNEATEEDPLQEESVPLDEAETDTQDTAEATTEEEGEIVEDDDDDDDEEDEEENDDDEDDDDGDAYESPLKRMAKAKAESSTGAVTASTSLSASGSGGGGTFSFKLGSSTAGSGSKEGAASSFKLPFSSPFSFGGDAPKPFSSSTFGGFALNVSKSSSIFAGSTSTSTTAVLTPSTSQTTKSTEAMPATEKVVPSIFAAASAEVKKKEIPVPAAEPEKQKQFSFSALAALGSSSAFGSHRSSSPSNTKQAPSSDPKPSIFAASKLSTASSSASSSSPLVFQSSSSMNTTAPPKTTVKQSSSTSQAPKDGPNPLLLTFNPDTSEAQELFSKRASTAEEKYRLLEARDKILRARIPKTKVNVEFATKLIGTCPDMCPEKERYMRQFQRQLVSYETLPGMPGQDVAVDHQKTIKAYSRSSADQEEPLPHELRPGPTLDFTMHYLLRFIVPLGDNPDENLSDWYNFLWDRTRSIRKDITQQQIIDLTAVSLFEKCARFHIHCASRLCELDVHSFDPKLNDENLMKCIQSLEHLYEDLRRKQINCPNEPEFRAYQIMMNLNEGDALYLAQQLPGWILNSNEVQTALKLHHCIYTKNFALFFRTVEKLPYMTSCILHRYFFQVRSLALRCFIKAHCTLPKYETAMPMSTLQRMLGYGVNSHSFSYLCEAHGIHCDVEENKVILKRKMFYLPEFPSIYRENHLIDSKLETSVAEAINGGPLPDIDFANRAPHSSFNENGQLIAGDIVGNGSNENQAPSAAFVPPEISSANRSQSKPNFGLFGAAAAAAQSLSQNQGGFSFGSGSSVFQQQPKREVAPPPPPKPTKEIDAACQAVTSRLIEDSVRSDVTQLSRARLDEAKRREKAERSQQERQIAISVAFEFLGNILAQQTDNLVRQTSARKLAQYRIADAVAQNTASTVLEESVLINLSISARTELIIAKEFYHRLLMTLKKIFQRVRARFAIQKWISFTMAKRMERERQEEKRREELWNFPAINSYSFTTKDVFKAFCGRSPVQPSLNKVDFLKRPPEDAFTIFNTRPKRKSDGDASEHDNASAHTPRKLPRLTSGGHISLRDQEDHERRLKDLWDFPAIDSYSRTNSQVLQALCGNSHGNMSASVSPKTIAFRKSATQASFFGNNESQRDNFIRRPLCPPSNGGRLSEEIKTKANESSSDFLKSIQNFMSQVKEETLKSTSIDTLKDEVEEFKRKCPEVNAVMQMREALNASNNATLNSSYMISDDELESDWMMETDVGATNSILSGIFVEEDNLLHKIRNFAKQVKEEKARSWNTDTFLNDLDLSVSM